MMNIPPDYKPGWNLYQLWHEEKPGIITLDLGWRNVVPFDELPHLGILSLLYQEETENGFISRAESERLAPVEDRLIGQIQQSQPSAHVAFFTFDGARRLVFYLSEPETFTIAVESLMKDLPWQYQVQVVENDNWAYYIEFLYPDAYSMQDIHTHSLLRQLEQHGDRSEVPRQVDYHTLFEDEAEAQRYAGRIAEEGFDSVHVEESENGFSVEFKKTHAADFDAIQENVYRALNHIEEDGSGFFGGWGCPVVK